MAGSNACVYPLGTYNWTEPVPSWVGAVDLGEACPMMCGCQQTEKMYTFRIKGPTTKIPGTNQDAYVFANSLPNSIDILLKPEYLMTEMPSLSPTHLQPCIIYHFYFLLIKN